MTFPASNPSASNPSASDELLWTAARYSWGELTPDEAARFEQRLEQDPAAQAALAEAVALHAAVVVAEQVSSNKPSAPAPVTIAAASRLTIVGRAAAWGALVTAACLALWFGLSHRSPDGTGATAQQPAGEAQRALAMAWLAGQPTDEVFVVDDASVGEEEVVELDAVPAIAEPSAPDWLIAAVVEAQTSPLRGEN